MSRAGMAGGADDAFEPVFVAPKPPPLAPKPLSPAAQALLTAKPKRPAAEPQASGLLSGCRCCLALLLLGGGRGVRRPCCQQTK